MAVRREVRGSFFCVLVERPAAVLGPAQTRDLVLLQRELVVVGDLLVDGDGLLRVDHDLLLGLKGDDLGVTVGLKDRETTELFQTEEPVTAGALWGLTVQQWLMNRARFPHLVASMMVSWSTLNK